MEENFKLGYNRLNSAQKDAVDSIDGPTLVIAGPGTGKTQLLTLRVANILKKTDATEENILCLTFTESAVNEMASRLNKFIGPSSSKITIDTYHGFGSNLIRQYPIYFNSLTALEPAGVLLINKQLKDITASLSVKNQFKNSKDLKDIKHLMSSFKKAALLPKDISKIVNDNLAFISEMTKVTHKYSSELSRISKKSLPYFSKLIAKEDNKAGYEKLSSIWNRELQSAFDQVEELGSLKPLTSWKTHFLSRDKDKRIIPAGGEQNTRLLDFIQVYESYLRRMDEIGRYDFDDMILKSIEALMKYPELKYTLAEQYQYILLDEYQDTNEAQAKLIHLLCDSPVNEGKPNIMAVGDDDQAIYSFQGASHSHMLDFYSRYKNVKLITLKTNYRSGQGIIDLSSSLAGQIESRLSKEIPQVVKDFNSAKKEKSRIELIKTLDPASEYSWIAENIKKQSKNINYSDIAVLAPKHKYLESLSTYLQTSNIPINYEKREDVLNYPLIVQLLQITRLLIAISEENIKLANHLLSEVLNYEFWQIDTLDIWKLSWESRSTGKDWITLMTKNPKLKTIATFLIKLSAKSLSERFDVILDQIIGLNEVKFKDAKFQSFTSPFYTFYKNDPNLMLSTFSALILIRKEFIDYSEDVSGPLMIKDYLNFIDIYQGSELTMTNSSPYIDSDDSVKLMTAYKAKGQEFDTVYMLSAIDEVWGTKSRSKIDRISLPPNLLFIKRQSLQTDDDKLRLIYVTASRAKNSLYLSSYAKNDNSKDTSELQYFTDEKTAKELSLSVTKNITGSTKQTTNNLISYYSANLNELLSQPDIKEILKFKLESYKLSPTHLNTFINVMHAGPDVFFNQVILSYPKPDSTSIIYGNAVHKALDFIQRKLTETNKLPALGSIQSEYISQLSKYHLTNNEFEDLAERGKLALSEYLKQNMDQLKATDLSELNFNSEGVVINEARLIGNIDKLVIDEEGKSLIIADYKTGTPHSAWSKQVPIHLNQNQLYFYKLLVNNSKKFKDYNVSSAYLHFISPKEDIKNILPLSFNREREEQIKQLITAVWQHINDLNFPDISNYPQDINGLIAFEEDLIKGRI